MENLQGFVRARRKELGLSQRALGDKCGLDPGVIASLESGRVVKAPTLDTLEQLAAGLRVDLIALVRIARGEPSERALVAPLPTEDTPLARRIRSALLSLSSQPADMQDRIVRAIEALVGVESTRQQARVGPQREEIATKARPDPATLPAEAQRVLEEVERLVPPDLRGKMAAIFRNLAQVYISLGLTTEEAQALALAHVVISSHDEIAQRLAEGEGPVKGAGDTGG